LTILKVILSFAAPLAIGTIDIEPIAIAKVAITEKKLVFIVILLMDALVLSLIFRPNPLC
jgi:hypothetical protein